MQSMIAQDRSIVTGDSPDLRRKPSITPPTINATFARSRPPKRRWRPRAKEPSAHQSQKASHAPSKHDPGLSSKKCSANNGRSAVHGSSLGTITHPAAQQIGWRAAIAAERDGAGEGLRLLFFKMYPGSLQPLGPMSCFAARLGFP